MFFFFAGAAYDMSCALAGVPVKNTQADTNASILAKNDDFTVRALAAV